MSFTNEGRGRDWRHSRSAGDQRADEETSSDRDDVDGGGARNSVLVRAFLMLEQVAGGSRPLNLTEMSRAAQLPLPTAHRLAKVLVELGALEKDAGRYTLGPVWSEWSETTGQEHTCTSG